jgi:hypothetical protein
MAEQERAESVALDPVVSFRVTEEAHLYVGNEWLASTAVPPGSSPVTAGQLDPVVQETLTQKAISAVEERKRLERVHDITTTVGMIGTTALVDSIAIYEAVQSNSNLFKAGYAAGTLMATLLGYGFSRLGIDMVRGRSPISRKTQALLDSLHESIPEVTGEVAEVQT